MSVSIQSGMAARTYIPIRTTPTASYTILLVMQMESTAEPIRCLPIIRSTVRFASIRPPSPAATCLRSTISVPITGATPAATSTADRLRFLRTADPRWGRSRRWRIRWGETCPNRWAAVGNLPRGRFMEVSVCRKASRFLSSGMRESAIVWESKPETENSNSAKTA